jgi:predicted MFS family arabinose efflux permease
VLVGIGMGLCIPALMGTLLAEVGPDEAGSAGGILNTVQNIGNALGVAITGVVFFGAVPGGYGHAFGVSVTELAGVGLTVAALALLLAAPARRGQAASSPALARASLTASNSEAMS